VKREIRQKKIEQNHKDRKIKRTLIKESWIKKLTYTFKRVVSEVSPNLPLWKANRRIATARPL
jgi:hypothetical protein